MYLWKLSHTLFRDQILLLRLPWILAGTLTLWVLYHLVEEALGRPQALLATLLLAIDQFHVTWTRVCYADIPAMAFEILVLWTLWKGLRDKKHRVGWFLLTGFFCAMGYYTKKTFPLVLLGMMIYFFACPKPGLRRPSLRALLPGMVLLALLVLPSILWGSQNPMENRLVRVWIMEVEPGIPFDLTPLSLYLGELFILIWPGMLEDYWNLFGHPVHWVAGIVYLLAAGWALFRRRRDPFIALMLAIFFAVTLVFLVIKTDFMGNHFWWASLSLIPAVVLASDALVALWRKSQRGRIIVSSLCVYLTLHLALSAYRRGVDYSAVSPEEWTKILKEEGEREMKDEQYHAAHLNFLIASKLDPKNVALGEQTAETFTLAYRQKIKRWQDFLTIQRRG
jgi:4-amino-4-deoxy-L-arabinose transferase-like glycosyltransferase